MVNQRTEFNGFQVIKPEIVIKLGVVFDSYKYDGLGALWQEAEINVAAAMPLFEAGDLFFQEEIQNGSVWYSFRYYTPKSNIRDRRN